MSRGLYVLKQVDDRVRSAGEDPGEARVEGQPEHARAADHTVAAQDLQRHQERTTAHVAAHKGRDTNIINIGQTKADNNATS